MNVLLTGSTGFVGSAVVKRLSGRPDIQLVAVVREAVKDIASQVHTCHVVGDLRSVRDWSPLMRGIDVVVHSAARAHKLHDSVDDPLAEFRSNNVDTTLAIAQAAAACGVQRLVFISTVGVHGSESRTGVISESTQLRPHSDYAQSKMEAEAGLLDVAGNSSLEVTILRCPLVYGNRAPGNLARLVRAVYKGFPFPFGSVRNKRSLLSVDNLAEIIELCLSHANASNEVFLVSDGYCVSTPDIITALSQGMNRRSRLFHCPDIVLRLVFNLSGKKALYTQLCQSLEIDSKKLETLLGWKSSESTLRLLALSVSTDANP